MSALPRPVCRRERGYTAVELMLALGLFAVGISGIIAMQKVTIVSNQHAKNLAIATHIAEAWLDQLAAEATIWNAPASSGQSSDLTDTTWVNAGLGSNNGVWTLPTPAYDAGRRFGRGFDALGAPVTDPTTARFCTHLRLTTLYQAEGLPVAGRTLLAGNGLIRAEVRVFWLRDGQTPVTQACSSAGSVATVVDSLDKYHSVYKVSAIRQHSTPK
jgi:hypothetical protein